MGFRHPTLAALILLSAAVSPAAADCICRARNVVALHGQTVCISTPEGPRLARCGKVSNVSSWTFLPKPCPLAFSDAPPAALVAVLNRGGLR